MKKGFTLIELLAVIVILAVIALIAVPRIIDAIDDARANAIYKNKFNMVKATKAYLVSNENLLPINGDEATIVTIDDLVFSGDFKHISGSNGNCDGFVIVSRKPNQELVYEPFLNCNSGNVALEAKYTLNNTLSDYSGNGNHLTPFTEANFIEGRNGSALSFVENDDRVWLTDTIELNDDFTISAWFRPSRASNYRFLNHESSFSYSYGYRNTTTLALWSPSRDISLSRPISTSEWNHHTLVKEDNVVKVYLNGKLVGQDTWTGSIRIDMIGGKTSNTSWSHFAGAVDEVTIFSRAMTDVEVRALNMMMNNM